MEPVFDPSVWAATPFHLWSVVFFLLGSMVGSFLNVCIHRMPLGQSVVSPGSHCPHCGDAIPWYLNLPLITWVWLRGRCRQCRAAISVRYFLVELLTALVFLAVWLSFGARSPALALVYCLFLAGLITATFIDFEHFIIPDEITLGGMVAGVLCSVLVPVLHSDWVSGAVPTAAVALKRSGIGLAVGWGIVYGILQFGKFMFGREAVPLAPDTRVVFEETQLVLPEQTLPYEEMLYRATDVIRVEARRVVMADRCYWDVPVELSRDRLRIGEETFDPESVPGLEVIATRLVIPREAMGFGDVKFMGAIGAFLGWQGALFSLMISAMVGALVGIVLIVLRKQEWSSRLPYGPYIALAAGIWLFGGHRFAMRWLAP